MKKEPIPIIIEVSARHAHLSKDDFEQLFGKGKKLTPMKKLLQDGQFASWEWVSIKTAKGEIEHVRVVGPFREQTQVEISLTDAYRLGIEPLIRPSGQLDRTPGLTLISEKAKINTGGGTILSQRHIHASTKEAKQYGLKDGQVVSVKAGKEREIIFNNVTVKVRDRYKWRFHIDTDEANAASIENGDRGGVIIK